MANCSPPCGPGHSRRPAPFAGPVDACAKATRFKYEPRFAFRTAGRTRSVTRVASLATSDHVDLAPHPLKTSPRRSCRKVSALPSAKRALFGLQSSPGDFSPFGERSRTRRENPRDVRESERSRARSRTTCRAVQNGEIHQNQQPLERAKALYREERLLSFSACILGGLRVSPSSSSRSSNLRSVSGTCESSISSPAR